MDRSNPLKTALAQAINYIEYKTAYKGAMTGAQIAEAVEFVRKNYRATEIAHSGPALASFDFERARAALKAAELVPDLARELGLLICWADIARLRGIEAADREMRDNMGWTTNAPHTVMKRWDVTIVGAIYG